MTNEHELAVENTGNTTDTEKIGKVEIIEKTEKAIEDMENEFNKLSNSVKEIVTIIGNKIYHCYKKFEDKYNEEDLENLKVIFEDKNKTQKNELYYDVKNKCFVFETFSRSNKTKKYKSISKENYFDMNLGRKENLYSNILQIEKNFLKKSYINYLY